jgi:isopenicillin N synthase-like dioxygenase
MATSTLSPQPVPTLSETSISVPLTTQSGPTIFDEVRAAQSHLRTRLAGALTTPPPNVPPSLLPTVPLIDLGPSFDPSTPASRHAAAQAIREACLTTGFFQISNHGITTSATEGILAQAERFFHRLTPAQKDELHVRHSPLFRGFEPGDYTYVNPDDNSRSSNPAEKSVTSKPESKQGFNFGYEPSLDSTGGDGKYVELDGSPPSAGKTNVWPREEDLPGFRDGVAEYYGQILKLARHLFKLFALSLGLEESYFDNLTTHPGGIGRLLYYPPSTQKASDVEGEGEGKVGLGAHTDYECFTLLLSDSNPGLEILFPPSALTDNKPLWRPCPIRPGTLTVNVADFLMRWTNSLYKSTVHRVVSKPGAPARYSVPFFFSINYDAQVEALPEQAVGRNVFKPMKAGQYVLERLKATKTLGEGVDDVGVGA